MAKQVITERLALLTIVSVFVGYLINPQAVAGAIYNTLSAIVAYWAD